LQSLLFTADLKHTTTVSVYLYSVFIADKLFCEVSLL